MQAKGAGGKPSKKPPRMPATDDEIREKYLERAIRELNSLTHVLQECDLCPRGNLIPVLGSGHPQADIFLLKHHAARSEVEEGVAFYGRAGMALMKIFKRLSIDPLGVYGTLCIKCPVGDAELAADECIAHVVEELAIVEPRLVVVMGEDTLDVLNRLPVPLSRTLDATDGEVQKLTPTIEAIVTPNIDECLDDQAAKRAFWQAFKAVGDWYADLPPY